MQAQRKPKFRFPMTAVGSCNKESLWLLLTCRLGKKQAVGFSQWLWPQADISVPELWVPQGGQPGIAPAPVFPQSAPLCKYQVSATVQQAPGDVWGHPWGQLHPHSGTALPGGCRVERTPSGHSLKVFFRVFIEALWWNLDLGKCYQDNFWLLSHPLIWWWPYFIILDFSISLYLWVPFSLHSRTLEKDFSDS